MNEIPSAKTLESGPIETGSAYRGSASRRSEGKADVRQPNAPGGFIRRDDLGLSRPSDDAEAPKPRGVPGPILKAAAYLVRLLDKQAGLENSSYRAIFNNSGAQFSAPAATRALEELEADTSGMYLHRPEDFKEGGMAKNPAGEIRSGASAASLENVGAINADEEPDKDTQDKREARRGAALIRAKLAGLVKASMSPPSMPGEEQDVDDSEDPDMRRTTSAAADSHEDIINRYVRARNSPRTLLKQSADSEDAFDPPTPKKMTFNSSFKSPKKTTNIMDAVETTNPFNVPKIPRGSPVHVPTASNAPDDEDEYANDLEVTASLLKRVFRL